MRYEARCKKAERAKCQRMEEKSFRISYNFRRCSQPPSLQYPPNSQEVATFAVVAGSVSAIFAPTWVIMRSLDVSFRSIK